jgi:carbamate kinase
VRIVVALGGNALLERGERPDAAIQRRHVRRAAQALAPLAAEHDLVLCHGNGPQVGVLALESAADPGLSEPYPLDVLSAETQGMIGYWLAQELRNAGITRPVVAVLTQTVVHVTDPAFAAPTKFIGPVYTLEDADALIARHGWTIGVDGAHWRRVVPSPEPRRIVETGTIRTLVDAGSIVICGGGGGIPVVDTVQGGLSGVDAVVDKDLTAAMLALTLAADRLLVLTDVPAVQRDFGTPRATPIAAVGADALADLTFPAGSMRPKVEACIRFVRASGSPAAIGALGDAAAVLAGTAGTTITAPTDVGKLSTLLDDPGVRDLIVGLAHVGSAPAAEPGAPRLRAVVLRLADATHPEQYGSWLSDGASNKAMTVDQVRAAIGDNAIDDLAGLAKSSPGAVAWQLAAVLPDLVDAVSPGGQVVDADLLARDFRQAIAYDDRSAGAFGPRTH